MKKAINIYLDKDFFYYFCTKKQNKKDKLISKNVSIDYAFEYCAAENFSEKKGSTTQKTLITSTHAKGHRWRKKT